MTQLERLLRKYQTRLYILKDNQKHDKTTGYPYDLDIKNTKEFIKDLKKLEVK